MRDRWLFVVGVLLLLGPTVLRAYLSWPLPGSQDLDSIHFAYRLSAWIVPLRLLGAVLAVFGIVGIFRGPRTRKTIALIVLVSAPALLLSYLIYNYEAVRLFRQPRQVVFAQGTSEQLPAETLVIGLTAAGQAKAYPLRLLAYHHQVQDQVGGQPVLVTYCVMCRTGKVFRAEAAGEPLELELVGAYRYNSVYRDRGTGSWWFQADGRAAVGPLAGEQLSELRTDQMTLGRWLELHPDSDVLQPDPASADGYQMFSFDRFDEARSESESPPGWRWVVGVRHGELARAYPWSLLTEQGLIEDQLGDLPLAVQLLADGVNHRVWDRRLGDRLLHLEVEGEELWASAAGTRFGFDGLGHGGELDGQQLAPVTSAVEYWHSFEHFSGGELFAGLP